MLRTLQFNVSVPTAYVFLNRFLNASQADKDVSLTPFMFIRNYLAPSIFMFFCLTSDLVEAKISLFYVVTCKWIL